MAGGYVNLFLVLFQAHQEMKTAILDTQRMIKSMGDKLNSVSYAALIPNIMKINQLFIDHSTQEEKEMIPILKEMYGPQVELAQYLLDEHMYIRNELSYLLAKFGEQGDESIDLNGDFHSLLEGVFEEIMVHLFEEENGLFPLLQGYLKSMREKTP